MKTPNLLIALTLVNFGLLAHSLVRPNIVDAEGVVPVLRGRALEIVDSHGRIRARIAVSPADPSVRMPNGTTGYPEAVGLKLMTSEGRPNVKLGTTEDGSGLVLGGEADPTYVQILSRGGDTFMKFSNQNGRERIVEPQAD